MTQQDNPQTTREFTDGLRKLADLLDEHDLVSSFDDHRHLIPTSPERMVEIARKIGGRWEKDALREHDQYFGMTRDLGGGVRLYVYTPREKVCTRKQVGTRMVQRPAPDAPMVEVEEPVYEWECAPSVLAVAS